jgi:hypothetical protein
MKRHELEDLVARNWHKAEDVLSSAWTESDMRHWLVYHKFAKSDAELKKDEVRHGRFARPFLLVRGQLLTRTVRALVDRQAVQQTLQQGCQQVERLPLVERRSPSRMAFSARRSCPEDHSTPRADSEDEGEVYVVHSAPVSPPF